MQLGGKAACAWEGLGGQVVVGGGWFVGGWVCPLVWGVLGLSVLPVLSCLSYLFGLCLNDTF